MSDSIMIKSVHKYAYKSGGTRRGGFKTTHIGSSYELYSVVLRFIPYELELVKSDKSTTSKIRNQENYQEEQTVVSMNDEVRVVRADAPVPSENPAVVASMENIPSVHQITKQ